MDKEELAARLMKVFLAEFEDHIGAFNSQLIALERGNGADRGELLKGLFRTAHSLKGAARSVDLGAIEACCHQLEDVLSAVRDGTLALDEAAVATLFDIADAFEAVRQTLAAGQPESQGGHLAQVAPKLAHLLGADGEPDRGAGRGTPAEPARTEPAPALHQAGTEPFVRVPSHKLDDLMAQVGELNVARKRGRLRLDDLGQLRDTVHKWRNEWNQATPLISLMAKQLLTDDRDGRFRGRERRARRSIDLLMDTGARIQSLERGLARLGAQLLEDSKVLDLAAQPIERDVHRARMVPFRQACEGLERGIRDIAKQSDKLVRLAIRGEDIELDRGIIDGLRLPLLHLVRNAVDHGIGTPSERQAASKPPAGIVTVTATLRGNRVSVAVADDGRGFDAAAAGLDAGADIRALLFTSGFSTADKITQVSGRGVGLDVVRTRVAQLRGTIDVLNRPGRGMVFSIDLPLTLSSSRVLVSEAAGQHYAVDADNVVRVLSLAATDIAQVEGRSVLVTDGRSIPVGRLADLTDQGGTPATEKAGRADVVILEAGDRQCAFIVDRVIGVQEIVAKAFPERIAGIAHYAGAYARPDGMLALILDAGAAIDHLLAAAPRMIAFDENLDGRRGHHVLVVDDSMTTRLLETNVLETSGYRVTAAGDGQEAWHLLQDNSFDLVVTDIEMPHIDGLRLTEMIRKTQSVADLPVILITAREKEDDKMRGLKAGANAYIVKSAFDHTVLLDTIERLLPGRTP